MLVKTGTRVRVSVRRAIRGTDLHQLRAVAMDTDTVLGATRVAVRDEVASGRLVELVVAGLPPLYADMGVVSLRNRSPSPMARHAIQPSPAIRLPTRLSVYATASISTHERGIIAGS